MWLWAPIGIMAVIIVLLLLKIYALQSAAREIESAFAEKLMTGTNTLIDLSSGDRYMCGLAAAINRELRILREERHQFEQGNMKLKNAVVNISHDLRTPLTAVCGYLDLLEQEEKSEAVERYLKIIRNRAEVLTQLTEELFGYSVVASGGKSEKREELSVNAVLEESIAASYGALRQRHITPNIQMPEKKIIRMLDRSALTRIFSNILSNAIKYSDGDLEITLSDTGEITFTNRASVLDELQVGRLFDRFYTVETAGNSTGLGLSIARTLAEQMHGSISAHYKNGSLSIYVFFPEDKDSAM